MQQNLLLKKQNLHKIRDLMRAVRQSVTMIVNAGKTAKRPQNTSSAPENMQAFLLLL